MVVETVDCEGVEGVGVSEEGDVSVVLGLGRGGGKRWDEDWVC